MESYIRNQGPDPQFFNCSGRTLQEWYARGSKSPILGYYFIASGIIFEMLYIPCLIFLVRSDCWVQSSYKIMFALGIVDMGAILFGAVATGWLFVDGAVYCTHPHFNYFLGGLCDALWCGSCVLCVTLSINRCMALWKSSLTKTFFGGRKGAKYSSAWLAGNNLADIFVTTTLSVLLCSLLYYRTRGYIDVTSRITKRELKVFIQCFLVCVCHLMTAIGYEYMQMFPVPAFFIVVGEVVWQLSHSLPSVIYLTLNPSISRGVLRLIPLHRIVPTRNTQSTETYRRNGSY